MLTKPREAYLADELENFQQAVKVLKPSPGEISNLAGIDIHGASVPLEDVVGGDHIIYVDFDRRYNMDRRIEEAESEGRAEVAERLRESRRRVGILLADVSGHKVTDALIAAMLHQAFLLGAYYELDRFGEITTKLFEHLNQRFYRTTNVNKYLTLLYGEISAEGRFRFLAAGHERPVVFSQEFGCFMPISKERLISFPPVGMLPSTADWDEKVDPGHLGFKQPYSVNEIDLLADGDILLLFTDGLSDHGGGTYFPEHVEQTLAAAADQTAEQICKRLLEDLLAFAKPQDDVSFVVIKKTPI
jgi:serine phosphatase RsbU (regulator of sigma subunit)